MPTSFCEPWELCTQIGRVLVSRTLYGPSMAVERSPLPFGAWQLQGGVLRPYMDLSITMQWKPIGPCYGPVASVFSLAPAERMTLRTRSLVARSTSQSLIEAAGRPRVRVRVRPRGTAGQNLQSGLGGAQGMSAATVSGGSFDSEAKEGDDRADLVGKFAGLQIAGPSDVELAAAFADKKGSFLQDFGAAMGAMFLGPAGAALGARAGEAVQESVEELVDEIVRNGDEEGSIIGNTGRQIDRMVAATQRAESGRSERETSLTTELESSVERVFVNPYRDRSLQLRVYPVFQQYELGLDVTDVDVGLAMFAGAIATRESAPGQATATRAGSLAQAGASVAQPPTAETRRALAQAAIDDEKEILHEPMAVMLHRQARKQGRNVTQSLDWAGSWVADAGIHAPFGLAEEAAVALQLTDDARQRFVDTIGGLQKGDYRGLTPTLRGKTVSIFIGTHIEAVPGECILPDVPDLVVGHDG